jgi:hypothetical protein
MGSMDPPLAFPYLNGDKAQIELREALHGLTGPACDRAPVLSLIASIAWHFMQ